MRFFFTKVVNFETLFDEILYKNIILKFIYQGTISLEKSYPGYDISGYDFSGEIVPWVRYLQRNCTHSIWIQFLLGTISPGYDFSSNQPWAVIWDQSWTWSVWVSVKKLDSNNALQHAAFGCSYIEKYESSSHTLKRSLTCTIVSQIFPTEIWPCGLLPPFGRLISTSLNVSSNLCLFSLSMKKQFSQKHFDPLAFR